MIQATNRATIVAMGTHPADCPKTGSAHFEPPWDAWDATYDNQEKRGPQHRERSFIESLLPV
jgi:hypothetical protein